MVYLISTVSNEFLYMNVFEWEKFKSENGVVLSSISGSNDSIPEYLRNKGVGVNIMKHSVVKKLLSDIEDCIFLGKSDIEKKDILDSVYEQNKRVVLNDDFGNEYCILLDDFFIKITVKRGENEDSYLFYYIDDNLVMNGYDEKVTYIWEDEGKYGQNVYRKC